MYAAEGKQGWRAFAEDYASHAAVSPYNALYDRPAVLDLLGPVAGKRILDVGCGPGLYAKELVDRGASVVGIDHSPEMIGIARAPRWTCRVCRSRPRRSPFVATRREL